MARLFLMRHAQPVSDGVKRFVGQTDPPLSREGRLQAAWWGDRLAGIEFSGIFSSDLVRARETAAAIAAGGQSAVTPLAGLREIHLGAWENRSFADIREQFPRQWHARGKDLAGYRPPGGESFTDLQERVLPEVMEMMARPAGNVLAVAHAGVNRVILCAITGTPLNRLFTFAQHPAALNLIDAHPQHPRVTAVNLSPATLGVCGKEEAASIYPGKDLTPS